MNPKLEQLIREATTKLLFSSEGYIFEKFLLMTRFVERDLPAGLAGVEPRSTEIVVYVNPCVTDLTSNALLTILKHEYNHVLLGHCWTRLPDPIRDNIAADLEINQPPFLELPEELRPVSAVPELFKLPKGKSREWYYQHLPTEGTGKGKESSQNKDGSKRKNIDSHDDWDKSEVQSSQSIYERIVREIVEAMKQKGDVPGSYIERIEAGWRKEPSLAQILKRIVTKCYKGSFDRKQTYLRPNRRNPILPGTKSYYGPTIVLAVDTSGSMSTKELQEIISVYRWIAKKCNAELIQCDAAVHEVTKNLRKTVIEVKGRGGTDFRPVFEYITKKYKDKIDLLIYGTDLLGDFPEKAPPYKVVWLTTSKERAPFGEIIRLKGIPAK